MENYLKKIWPSFTNFLIKRRRYLTVALAILLFIINYSQKSIGSRLEAAYSKTLGRAQVLAIANGAYAGEIGQSNLFLAFLEHCSLRLGPPVDCSESKKKEYLIAFKKSDQSRFEMNQTLPQPANDLITSAGEEDSLRNASAPIRNVLGIGFGVLTLLTILLNFIPDKNNDSAGTHIRRP